MHTLGLNGGGVVGHDEWYYAGITYPLPLQARHRLSQYSFTWDLVYSMAKTQVNFLILWQVTRQ